MSGDQVDLIWSDESTTRTSSGSNAPRRPAAVSSRWAPRPPTRPSSSTTRSRRGPRTTTGSPPTACARGTRPSPTRPSARPSTPGAVPDGEVDSGEPLRLTKDELDPSRVELDWSPSCHSDGSNYAVYRGTIGDWAGHHPVACSTEGATEISVTPEASAEYYLVVPFNERLKVATASGDHARPRPASLATRPGAASGRAVRAARAGVIRIGAMTRGQVTVQWVDPNGDRFSVAQKHPHPISRRSHGSEARD